jgi:hypothetical protein
MILRTPGFDLLGLLAASAPDAHPAGGESRDDPSEGDLREALDAWGRGDLEYVILEDDTGSFIQVAGDADGPPVLERQDGSPDRHFRADERGLTQERVRAAFLAVRRGDPSWREEFSWARVSF